MRKKRAFTLAEVVMFLVVVSILLAIVLSITKPKQVLDNKSVQAKYASVFDSLNLATFALMDKDETDPFVLTADDVASGKTNFHKLCLGLTEYINTDTELDACDITPLPEPYLTDENRDFRNVGAHFVSLTGVKFYLSDLIVDDLTPATDRSYYDEADPDYAMKFFIVYADFNAFDQQRHAHTVKYNSAKKEPPNVFAFAIVPTGDAIPLGLAEYDPKYLAVRVSNTEDNIVRYSSNYSYREAKHVAWRFYRPTGDNVRLVKTLPYTYNDAIKEIMLRNGSQLWAFNNDGSYEERYGTPLLMACNPPVDSSLTNFDMCSVVPNTPEFKMRY